MFKFLPDQDTDQVEPDQASVDLRPGLEIPVKSIHYEVSEKVSAGQQNFGGNFLPKCIQINQLTSFLEADDKVQEILGSTSDLISGKYEGGFKIWECTVDLIKYLDGNNVKIGPKMKILDLGCGSGFLGLYGLSGGADVDFQDYNSEVLDYLTIPNVILNFKDDGLLRCRFYSGDWGSLSDLWNEGNQYDIILSAETIYNLEYLPNLLKLVKSCLKPQGCLYLAAKTYYFGVGGGTREFLNLVKQDSSLKAEVVHVLREGVQREIIKVSKIES